MVTTEGRMRTITPNMRNYIENKDEKVKECIRLFTTTCLNSKEISETLGVSPSTIQNWLRENGVNVINKRNYTENQIKILADEYIDITRSIDEIATAHGMSMTALRRLMKANGITRPQSSPTVNPSIVQGFREEWKTVESYEGIYEVSNTGKVRNIRNNPPKLMSIEISRGGYARVGLNKNNKQKHFQLHRLVASAFVPNPENKPQVNHIDENKLNNNAYNLEWCTHLENSNHGTKNKRVSENQIKECKTGKPIEMLDVNGNIISTYKSIKDASRKTGINISIINDRLHGRVKSLYKGNTWRYIN